MTDSSSHSSPESNGSAENTDLPPAPRALHLFDAIGVEIEYMIVDADTLNVSPICDQLMTLEAGETVGETAGEVVGEVERGRLSWSNELALHVVELKTTEPTASLENLDVEWVEHLAAINAHLQPLHAKLLPTAMHPWMNPHTELQIWPHEYDEVYRALDRIFDCRGHGWANLQSTHINLPFQGDDEFGRLHAAVRLVLPLLPAVAASSPFCDGRSSGLLDTRMAVYATNSSRMPSVAGRVIPEAVFTQDAYQSVILDRIYSDLRPVDPAGVLQHEWANARGAIARFTRGSIEIRVIDAQETPAADLAIVGLAVAMVQSMAEDRWSDQATQRGVDVEPLADLLVRVIQDGMRATVSDPALLAAYGLAKPTTVGQLLRDMLDDVRDAGGRAASWLDGREAMIEQMLRGDSLAERMIGAAGLSPVPQALHATCQRLADGVTANQLFVP